MYIRLKLFQLCLIEQLHYKQISNNSLIKFCSLLQLTSAKSITNFNLLFPCQLAIVILTFM